MFPDTDEFFEFKINGELITPLMVNLGQDCVEVPVEFATDASKFNAAVDQMDALLTFEPSADPDRGSNEDFVPLAPGAEIALAELVGPGRITHFRARLSQSWLVSMRSMGRFWRKIARDGVEVHWIPGGHYGMLRGAGKGVVVDELYDCLQRAKSNQ